MVHHTGFFGATGSGKSTLMKERVKAAPRAVVYDPMGEYGGVQVETLQGLHDALKRHWGGRYRICYRSSVGGDPETLHAVSVMMQRFFEGQGQEVLFGVEEMSRSYPVGNLPRNLSGFTKLCNMGRHWGISLAGSSQRMAEVGTTFRGNLQECFILRMPYKGDQQAAEKVIGSEHRAAINALRQFEYLHLKTDSEIVLGKVRRGS